MKGDLFVFIASELSKSVPELQSIELNKGQLNQNNEHALYPYVLINFKEAEYKEEGHGMQTGSYKVMIDVVQKNEGLNIGSDLTNNVVVDLLNFPHKIYLALQDKVYNPDYSFKFSRSGEEGVGIQGELLISPIEFTVTFQDASKREEYLSNQVKDPNAEINII